MKCRNWSVIGTWGFSCLAALALASQTCTAALSPGDKAPSFTAKSVEGETVSLPGTKGAVVVINFWGPWLPPSLKPLPDYQKLYEKYHRKGLDMVGIAWDDQPVEKVKAVIKQFGLTFPVVHDPKGSIAQQYQVRGMPAAYVIAKDNKIRFVQGQTAPIDEKLLEKQINELLP